MKGMCNSGTFRIEGHPVARDGRRPQFRRVVRLLLLGFAWLGFWSGVLCGPALADTLAPEWLCPAEAREKYKSKTPTPIVRDRNEKFYAAYLVRPYVPPYLSFTLKGLFVFTVPFPKSLPILREASRKRFGEARYSENPASNFLDSFLETVDEVNRSVERSVNLGPVKQARGKLESFGIPVENFRQATIVSNVIENFGPGGGSLQVRLRVIDGTDLFGLPSTAVILSRVDRRSGVTLNPHTIFAYITEDVDVVTGTEYALMSDLARRVGAKFSLWPLVKRFALKDYESFIAAKRWLKSQNTASPELGAPLDIGQCPAVPMRWMNRRGNESAE